MIFHQTKWNLILQSTSTIQVLIFSPNWIELHSNWSNFIYCYFSINDVIICGDTFIAINQSLQKETVCILFFANRLDVCYVSAIDHRLSTFNSIIDRRLNSNFKALLDILFDMVLTCFFFRETLPNIALRQCETGRSQHKPRVDETWYFWC